MGKHKNQKQEQVMVEFMGDHPEMANGYPKGKKAEIDALWDRLTSELNEFGPPKKECSDWKKSWVDWKASLKKRINCKNDDNSSIRLTNAEEFIVKLCRLSDKVEINGTPKLQKDDVDDTSLINLILGKDRSNSSLDSNSSIDNTSNRCSLKRKRETLSQENLNDFLSSDASFQEDLEGFPSSTEGHTSRDISKTLEGISKTTQSLVVKADATSACLKRICGSLNDFCTLQAEKNKEMKRHHRVMEELMRQKNMIKMRSLELQELQFKREQDKLQQNTFEKCEDD